MSLLREIQSAAIDSSIPLTTLLRKCKVLAARLGNEEFKAWVDRELNGYESADGLPEYRSLRVNSKGHFSGAFGSGLRNADIPMLCIPENLRDGLSHSRLMQPIATIEDLVRRSDSSILQEAWNPDIVAHFGGSIYEHMNCLQAWKVIPISALVAATDTIRTRILSFVLDVEAESPGAGEAAPNISPLPQDRVHQIFNTHIYGVVQNLANASPGAQQSATYTSNSAELFRQLSQAIENSGAPVEVVRALSGPVSEMADADSPQSFRSSYLKFMAVLADHMQVMGMTVAPFLPQLAAMLG